MDGLRASCKPYNIFDTNYEFEAGWDTRGHLPRACFPYPSVWPKMGWGIIPFDHYLFFVKDEPPLFFSASPTQEKYPSNNNDICINRAPTCIIPHMLLQLLLRCLLLPPPLAFFVYIMYSKQYSSSNI